MSASQRLSPASFVRHASDVSAFYGFRPIHEVEKGLAGRRSRSLHTFQTSIESCTQRFIQQKRSEPVLAYYASAAPLHTPTGISARDVGEFGLHVVGTTESLGEIILLKTLFSIVTEWGARVSRVRVNALGDRDSKSRFERELTGYLRKHAHLLDPVCRKAVGESPLTTYGCTNDACRDVLGDGPRSMNFLSEKSREHFREVLEYIESLGLPYEVDDLLVGDTREPSITFALDLDEPDATIVSGVGGRFDEYVRKLNARKDGAGASASIFFRKKGLVRSAFVPSASQRAPKIYFVQLGLRAKLQSLSVVDMLRAAQVPVSQSFDARSLAPQMESARAQGVSHLLIMGQREAIDGTIIVRSMLNSSQTTVPIAILPRYLKTLKV